MRSSTVETLSIVFLYDNVFVAKIHNFLIFRQLYVLNPWFVDGQNSWHTFTTFIIFFIILWLQLKSLFFYYFTFGDFQINRTITYLQKRSKLSTRTLWNPNLNPSTAYKSFPLYTFSIPDIFHRLPHTVRRQH